MYPARYVFYLNKVLGMVIIKDSYAPYPQANLGIEHFSDFLYVYWKKECAADAECMKGLHGILRSNIQTETTQNVIYEIIGGEQNLRRYPGTVYLMNSDEGKALAETPQGWGVFYSLWQHQSDWEGKTVYSFRIFASDVGGLCMLITLTELDSSQQQSDPAWVRA